ncbi:AB hydrolase-1 domain-containing protein [Mycena chlorophos]|uniref:AB hydrolase-1 domain-containing protein n=1 Tax=Mycena chlorophos TaxID=658473 RepID=A0A8H6S804_MYCCL|nr:AB hydrolase-1 domain-containing protein [Mycena chlorophos]
MTYFSSHTFEIPNGIKIFYTDSGAPPNSDAYTTLVMLHGSAFNGDGMSPLHAFAHRHNLRIILWNRRDYRGSTPYSDAELEELRTGKQSHWDAHAQSLMHFFAFLIDVEKVPSPGQGAGRGAGGIILGGWSFGAATALSVLAAPSAVPLDSDLYKKVELYFKSLVLYDSSPLALGTPVHPEIYDPFNDPEPNSEIPTLEDIYAWVSSYYTHPDIASEDVSGISRKAKRAEQCTVESWTAEEREAWIEGDAAGRCELPCYVDPVQATLKEQARRALYDPVLTKTYFPDVTVLHISLPETCPFPLWGYFTHKRDYEAFAAEGRATRFKMLERGNHFVSFLPFRFFWLLTGTPAADPL